MARWLLWVIRRCSGGSVATTAATTSSPATAPTIAATTTVTAAVGIAAAALTKACDAAIDVAAGEVAATIGGGGALASHPFAIGFIAEPVRHIELGVERKQQ